MKLQEFFDTHHIKTETIEHKPVMTVQEMDELNLGVPACKNLFLKDSKKRFWLVSAMPDTAINLKQLGKTLNAAELRFAQADLLRQYLGVEPGSVTLYSLINDPNHQVAVVLDKAIYRHERVGFHPLRNTATTIIKTDDIPVFLKAWGGKVVEVSFYEN
jgi:Ala-tRNA(Pro) deacylase